jgi:hypothetical protein
MGENLPTEDEKLRAYSSIMCNLQNIHYAMFPPSFGEKNEKLNSNLSFGGGGMGVQRKKKTLDPNGNSQGENPLTSQKEKRKKNTCSRKLQRKKIAPKNKEKHT